jgi:hypothetical protein
MTQFTNGQDVEVLTIVSSCGNADVPYWRKAKIVEIWTMDHWRREYTVQFMTGEKHVVFNAAHIRAICPICAAGGGMVA